MCGMSSRILVSRNDTKAGRAVLSALLLSCLSLSMATAEVAVRQAYLDVISAENDTLIRIPMPEGKRWCLGWNHSVAGFPVLDCYRHVGGEMRLERSHQPDFAAGLGHTEGRGEMISDGRGGYWIENIDEPVPGNRYVLRVGSQEVDHRLLWRADGIERQWSLSAVAAGERVTLRLSLQSSHPDKV